MAKHILTVNDTDNLLISLIPPQPTDGYEEGTKVDILVKYNTEKTETVTGSDEIIPHALYSVVMDSAKTITITKDALSITPPKITVDLNDTATLGDELSITATGDEIEYSWYKEDQEIKGANKNTYTPEEEGEYYCKVLNVSGVATSKICVVSE